ncbi:Spy/CpxP family protein refolding chaperone [Lutibacter holmesii]|uniref:Spy/CpxP family protein refolding chaperone n=1 Tax=Lutibacter holmesii TaxID=1137985 RepID=A0ABW3WNW9_9FLAO
MKKIIGITVIAMLISLNITAQKNNKQQRNRSDFTPEQMATLKVKKMTLDLDLNDSQQKEIYAIEKTNAEERVKIRTQMRANRDNGVQLSSDEKFELQQTRLDKMIAHKAALKTILTKDQFTKWEENMNSRKRDGKKQLAQNKQKGKKGGNQQGRQNNNRI